MTPTETPSRTPAPRASASRAPRTDLTGGRAPASRRILRPPVGHRTGLFVALLTIVITLILLGTVMGLSVTAAPSLASKDSAWSMFRNQGMWITFGLGAMLVTLRVDYHRWRKWALLVLGVAMLLLVLTTLPGWGISTNGAQRWLGVGSWSFQPSELAKPPFILFVARLLSLPSRPISYASATLNPVVVLTSVCILLLLLQPHLGASMMIVCISMSMLFFAGTPILRLATLGAAALLLTVLVVALTPWRRARLGAFLDPWADPMNSAYQPLRSLHAMASGGIRGAGLGAGRSKWGFLPDAHTDFIFAVIGEELGMLGTLFVVLAFALIGVVGLFVALRAPDRFGMLLAAGITSWIVLQAGLNIGAVLGLFPVVGITLPLLSVGGSSMVSTLAAVGVLLNVARQAQTTRTRPQRPAAGRARAAIPAPQGRPG